ncbi:hypothetical protein G8A07_18210 [Roseateles sp. DAIF2]|uniref:hypothetical protein n=1 Tax=Roseateles sp. DAIF2 TaxID=2714952 RepID=UPI0018A24C1F|nr:hypothetical protein [Roseateles sp. DAIF2]QPF74661.1 hypothetical protein G8A07_18210 [Roseateles sp. DAIF2]
MHAQPFPCWYLYALDAAEPVHLLTDEGQPSPELSTEPARLVAELAAAIHATAWQLGEPELRCLEQCIALQRWRR